MANPTPKIAQRVRVQILPSSDAQKPVELDYRTMILGDFSKKPLNSQGDLKDRKIREIRNKADFKAALSSLNPKLMIAVENRISGGPEDKLDVNLDFKDMKDFHPDAIADRVAPLKELMQARERLKALKLAVLKDPKLKKAIESVLEEGKLEDLTSKLALP